MLLGNRLLGNFKSSVWLWGGDFKGLEDDLHVALESFKGHKGMFGSLNGKEIKG